MRIAYISNGNPDAPAFDQLFISTMVRRGYKPYYISCWAKDVDYSYLGVENFQIYPSGRNFRFFRLIHNLRSLIKKIQPDVLHSGWIQTAGFYAAYSGFRPILSMPWGHDILSHLDEEGYSESWHYKLKTNYTINRADRITCDCELVKQRIIEMYGYPAENIIVFPWGVDQCIYKPASSPSKIRKDLGWEDKKVIIMNRLFTPRRGIGYFIEAFSKVVHIVPETRVLLVGYGPLQTELENMVTRLNLKEYVHFTGRINNEDMPDYLQAADIYVTTSLSDGTSVSLLEAIACGLPVIVADAPAYFEWVDDGVNGFIVPRKDSVVLAERLVTLLRDHSMRQMMGKRNLEIAHERADWNNNFGVLEDIYKELVCIKTR